MTDGKGGGRWWPLRTPLAPRRGGGGVVAPSRGTSFFVIVLTRCPNRKIYILRKYTYQCSVAVVKGKKYNTAYESLVLIPPFPHCSTLSLPAAAITETRPLSHLSPPPPTALTYVYVSRLSYIKTNTNI